MRIQKETKTLVLDPDDIQKLIKEAGFDSVNILSIVPILNIPTASPGIPRAIDDKPGYHIYIEFTTNETQAVS